MVSVYHHDPYALVSDIGSLVFHHISQGNYDADDATQGITMPMMPLREIMMPMTPLREIMMLMMPLREITMPMMPFTKLLIILTSISF